MLIGLFPKNTDDVPEKFLWLNILSRFGMLSYETILWLVGLMILGDFSRPADNLSFWRPLCTKSKTL